MVTALLTCDIVPLAKLLYKATKIMINHEINLFYVLWSDAPVYMIQILGDLKVKYAVRFSNYIKIIVDEDVWSAYSKLIEHLVFFELLSNISTL